MPERFLLQILRNLVNHGLLKSTRGVDGGYSLTRPLDEITLLQMFEATEGPQTASLPPLDSMPEASQTKLLGVLGEISASAAQRLSQTKLSDLYTPKPDSFPPKAPSKREDEDKPKPK